MARSEEFVGIRTVHMADAFGEGQHAYSMHLTDERIVRCRDCKFYNVNKEQGYCTQFSAWVDANGFCSFGEERDAE